MTLLGLLLIIIMCYLYAAGHPVLGTILLLIILGVL